MSSGTDGAVGAVTFNEHVTKDGSNLEEDSRTADDIREISVLSSASVQKSPVSTTVNVAPGKTKYRSCLKVLQKINMVFLVLFVCYFVWTISANYAGRHGDDNISGNATNHINATHFQVEDTNNSSGNRYIPYFTSKRNDGVNNDVTYHSNVVIPAHRKQTKKRRKKGRGKKRNRRLRNRQHSRKRIEEYLNLTNGPRRNKNGDNLCHSCKIKKRKSRHRFGIGRIRASTLRRILEKVADDTLSGARSGDGTLMSLHGENVNKESGWSKTRHVIDVNRDDTDDDVTSHRINEVITSDGSKTSWTVWSSCSATCGAGQQERMRDCGTACREVESMVCIRPACKGVPTDEIASTITEFYKWEKEGFIPPLKPPKQEFLDPNVDACSEWVDCNKDFTHDYLTNSLLPGCPCFYPLKRLDRKEIHDVILDKTFMWEDASSHSDLVYKPEARACIRSRLSSGAVNLAVQQCCYDGSLMLVTRGKSAGTPNLISVDISTELHYKLDLLPWIICKGDWTRYNQVLPPDNQLKCPSNPDDTAFRRQQNEVNIY